MAQPTSKQFPFPQLMTCRPGGAMVKDSFMKNMYVEGQGQKAYAVKRPGQNLLATAPVGATSWPVMGMCLLGNIPFWFVKQPGVAVGYFLDQTGAIWNTGGTFATWTPPAADTYLSTLNNFTLKTSFASNTGWYLTAVGSYQSLDIFMLNPANPVPATLSITHLSPPSVVNVPAHMRPGIVFIDGTLYVMDADTSQIRGSNLQDPLTWNLLNVVGTSFNTGTGTGIIRHLNYLVAFYMRGVQLFYDAGLAPPGSPLAPLPNGSFQLGCAVPETAVNIGDSLIFVSQTTTGDIAVTMLQGLSFTPISTPAVNEVLIENAQYLAGPVGQAANVVNAYAYSVALKGHTWYVLRLPTITLAYDLNTKDWQFWTSVNVGAEGTHNPTFSMNNYAVSFETGALGKLSQYQTSAYTDYNGYINCIVQTPSGDSETVFKKFQTRMNFYGDTIADTMTVAYCNDDFVTWSSPLTIDLSTQRKFVNRLGSFYHRAYQVTYTGNLPFRMEKMEALLELGTA